MRDRTRELQGKQTMPNIVATPILAINGSVCQPKISGKWRAGLIKGPGIQARQLLVIFGNIRTHSERTGETDANYSQATKGFGLHQAVF